MGMYDSVIGRCPHCRGVVELQSKAGPGLLNRYSVKRVPAVIAEDLRENRKDFNTTCPHCQGKFEFQCQPITRIRGKLVAVHEDQETVEYNEDQYER